MKLWRGNENLAQLEYGRWSRQKAQVMIAGKGFSLTKASLMSRQYLLKTATFEEVMATIRPRLWGPGTIEFADGGTYKYRRASWRGKLWEVTDLQGNLLLQMELRSGLRKGADVRWLEKGRADKHSLQLTALLMYIVLLFQEQATTAGGVGAGIGGS